MNNTEVLNETYRLFNITNTTTDIGNSSFTSNRHIFFDDEGSCPKWLLYVYLIFFFCGSCVNLMESFALIRCKKNGVISIILQIILVDTLLFFVAVLEILTSYHHQSWKFSTYTCMFFRGSETLTNTLILYLIICLNFHVITLWNLYAFETLKNRNPLTSLNENSSVECLVTRNETRALTIDYRKRKDDVSVLLPSILIWFLCLSISIPNFVLSSTLEMQGMTLCVIIENIYGTILHGLLLVVSTTVPCCLLLISFLITIFKFSKTSQKDIDNVLTKKVDEIRRLLIVCVVITVFYMLTSYQRYVFSMNATIMQTFFIFKNGDNNFSYVYQTMFHYSGTAVRGILFYYMVPKLKEIILDKLYFCRNKDT